MKLPPIPPALLAIAILTGGAAAALQIASAQSQESIEIPVGSIFEILGESETPGTQFSWVLTQDRNFIAAGRDPIFQTRFAQPGTYELAAEATDEAASERTQRTFVISVRPRQPEDNILPEQSGTSDIIQFVPPLENETIVMPAESSVLSLTPLRRDVEIHALDMDAERDGNGDGDSANDDDTRGTLFQKQGNPLHLWFVAGITTRPMRLGVLFTNKNTYFQNFTVISSDSDEISTGGDGFAETEEIFEKGPETIQPDETGFPRETPSETDLGTPEQEGFLIRVEKNDNGKVSFLLDRGEDSAEKPLLLHWDFGDGHQSLLDSPIHTYAEAGNFAVAVTVRDLRTAKEVGSANAAVFVSKLREPGEGETETEEEPASAEATAGKKETKKTGGGLLGLLLKILITLMISGGIGAGTMFVVAKLRKGRSLEDTLASAEGKIVGKPKTLSEAPPMEIAAEAAYPVEAEFSPEPQKPETEPRTEPSSATPDWLMEGIAKAEGQAAPPSPPVEAPTPVALEPQPPAPPTDTAGYAPVPDWLTGVPKASQPPSNLPEPEAVPAPPQPEAAPVMPESEADPPMPAPHPSPIPPPPPLPQKEPAPKPLAPMDSSAPNVAHTPMEPTALQLHTDEEKAPDWLRAGIEKAQEEGQTPVTPPPPALLEGTADRGAATPSIPEAPPVPEAPIPTNLQEPPGIPIPDDGSDPPVAFVKAEDIPPKP